jgi:hypothetical protein
MYHGVIGCLMALLWRHVRLICLMCRAFFLMQASSNVAAGLALGSDVAELGLNTPIAPLHESPFSSVRSLTSLLLFFCLNDPTSALSLESLLDRVTAVLVGHLQVVFFLGQVCHLSLSCLLFFLETFLNIWDRRANEPITIRLDS